MKYMLIEVCEREITTNKFATFAEANDAMMKALYEEYKQFCNGEDNWKENWNNITSNDRYDDEDMRFSFGRKWAWSNLDSDFNMDWKIVHI